MEAPDNNYLEITVGDCSVSKSHPLAAAYLAVEELNVEIGLARIIAFLDDETRYGLTQVQRNLVKLTQEIRSDRRPEFLEQNPNIDKECMKHLDTLLNSYDLSETPRLPWNVFDRVAAVSRRAEHHLIILYEFEEENFYSASPLIPEDQTPYLNYLRKNCRLRLELVEYVCKVTKLLESLARTV